MNTRPTTPTTPPPLPAYGAERSLAPASRTGSPAGLEAVGQGFGEKDRRRGARRPLRAGVKLVREQAVRFVAGRTCNLSPTGCLIEIIPDRPVRVGERVRVGIDEPATGVVRDTDLRPARIVRVEEIGACAQYVALCFETPRPALRAA